VIQLHAAPGNKPENGTSCLAASFSTPRSIESSRLHSAASRGRLLLTLPPPAGNPGASRFAADDAMPRTFVRTLPS
jgi:hypothetical protein